MEDNERTTRISKRIRDVEALIASINVALEHVQEQELRDVLDRAKTNLLEEVDIYIDYLKAKRGTYDVH